MSIPQDALDARGCPMSHVPCASLALGSRNGPEPGNEHPPGRQGISHVPIPSPNPALGSRNRPELGTEHPPGRSGCLPQDAVGARGYPVSPCPLSQPEPGFCQQERTRAPAAS